MKKRGFKCIEIDASIVKNSRKIIDELRNKPIIFITSAHFLLDYVNYKDFYPTNNEFYGILDTISILKPKKSVFIPHDLTQPLIKMEKYFLNLFDLFISPCEPFTSIYSSYCRTVELGWVKYRDISDKKKFLKKSKAVWFLSDFILHIKMGKEKSYELLSPIVKQGVAMKFPFRPPYSSQFEEYYSKMGIPVYSMHSNTIDLIKQHNIIITNGLSSTIAESYWFGKPTVNIMEGSYYGEDKAYLEELFPNLIFVKKIKDFNFNRIPAKKGDKILKPFDMQTAIELITEN